MRVDLEKWLFIGLEKEREAFFAKAQEAGLIEFIDTRPVPLKTEPLAGEVEYALAMKVLRGLPPVKQLELDNYEQADKIVHEICELYHTLEMQREELRMLQIESARVAPFGDFSLEDIQKIEQEGKRVIQFFAVKSHLTDGLLHEEGVVKVASAHGMDYFVSVQTEKRSFPNCVEMQIPQPLGALQTKMRTLSDEMHSNEQALKGYAKYNHFLQDARVEQKNQYHYRASYAKAQLPLEDKLFAVEGWVAVNKREALQKLADSAQVHTEKVAIQENEVIPTYLENQGISRLGEDLIRIYDTPANTDNDPSLWVFGFFALFFAMIVGDGGYGLVYLALALYGWYAYPKIKGAGRRFLKLMTILATACVCWGILTATFFGVTLDYHHPFRKAAVLDFFAEKKMEYHMHTQDSAYQSLVAKYPAIKEAKTGMQAFDATNEVKGDKSENKVLSQYVDGALVELVLFLAIFHLILSLARYGFRNWPAIGWILFLIGAYLYVPHYLGSTSMVQSLLGISADSAAQTGRHLLIGGMCLAVVLSLIQNRWLGLLEITNVLGLSADTLSYLRIYALALSGAIMAATVNELAGNLPAVFAILLLGAGHMLNMTLATMGGVIHGLRLNFLEWYRYSFQGGGKPFIPLATEKIER